MDYKNYYCCCCSFLDKSVKFGGFFEKANKLSDKISKFLTVYFPIYYGIQIFFIAAMVVMYCYITRGYVEVDYLFAPYKFA